MTNPKIARAVLNCRNSLSYAVDRARLTEEIGSDGLQVALNNRWLTPCPDTGSLRVTQEAFLVSQMEEVAEKPEKVQESVPMASARKFFGEGRVQENDERVKVGDAVTVAQDGKAYTATISSIDGEGNARLTYSNAAPRDRQRTYKTSELGAVGQSGEEQANMAQ